MVRLTDAYATISGTFTLPFRAFPHYIFGLSHRTVSGTTMGSGPVIFTTHAGDRWTAGTTLSAIDSMLSSLVVKPARSGRMPLYTRTSSNVTP